MEVKKRDSAVNSLDEFITKRKAKIAPTVNTIPLAKEIAEVIKETKKPIYIVGDYDVDGVCASAILFKAITDCKPYKPIVRLPRRHSEGYGLSTKIVDEIPTNTLLITVDNGIAAVEAIEKAIEKGIDVIVTDHHLKREDGILPPVKLLLDPNAVGEQVYGQDGKISKFTQYCGAGLAYKIAEHLINNQELLNELSTLAAVATIADVVPLVDENWTIGTRFREIRRNEGLAALCELFNLPEDISTTDIGFKIAPALNAPGRLLDNGAELSFELLAYNDNSNERAIKNFQYNEQRKDMTEEGISVCHKIIEDEMLYGDKVLIITGNFNEGIVGILAGRMAEEFNVPSIVLTEVEKDGKRILKGSGRSARDVHLKNLLDKASDLMLGYGGHAGAAGLSLPIENFELFVERLNSNVVLAKEDNTQYYDIYIKEGWKLSEYAENNLSLVESLAPYGEGNPEPVFLVNKVRLSPRGGFLFKRMGNNEQHIKLFGKNIDLLCFDMTNQYEEFGEPDVLTLIGKLSKNIFRDKISYQVEVINFEKYVPYTETNSLKKKLLERASKI